MSDPTLQSERPEAGELARLREQLELLRAEAELSKKLLAATTLDDLLDEIVDHTRVRWGFEMIGIQLLDEERHVLQSYRSHGAVSDQARASLLSEVPLDPEVSVSAWVALKQRPVYSSADRMRTAALTPVDRAAVDALGVAQTLMVPVIDVGKTIGVVQLGTRHGGFALSPEAQHEAADFIHGMAIPIQRIRARDQLERARREQEALAVLSRRISATIELDAVLDILADEFEASGLFDGVSIRLVDEQRGRLCVRKVRVPPAFEGMSGALANHDSLLTSDEPVVRALKTNQPVFLDPISVQAEGHLAAGFEFWRVQSAAILPIPLGDEAIGTVFAFSQTGMIDPDSLHGLRARLPLFSEQIRNARLFAELKQREEEIRTASAQHQRFLDFVNHTVALTDSDQIYDLIAREFLRLLPFDLAGVVVREGERLVGKHIAGRDESVEPWRRAWEGFCGRASFGLAAADGATSYVYAQNTRLLIPDVMAIRDLPMADIDREAVALMPTPRTFLFVPLRRQGQAVGVLWLIAGRETVPLSEEDIRLVEALCAVIGTAIGNAALYTTVEQQRRELARTQGQLASAKEAAEASAAARGAFVANTSHEIRTPLTAIIGFAEQLLDGAAPGSGVAGSADVILRNGRHLLGLINDLLDLSKIEAGHIELDRVPFSPMALLDDVRATVELLAREKNLTFRIEFAGAMPGTVSGDPARLRQALLNLCNNAVKFTDQGEVSVRVACDRDTERLHIAVRDSGIGVAPGDLDRLFEPFFQADSTVTRRYGGTGLGLPITRELIHGMGGEMRVSSELGRGSVFEFWLPTGPLAEAEWLQAPAIAPTGAAPSARLPSLALGGRVLLAEDGIDNQRLLTAKIRNAGAEVLVVENGEDAVTAALADHFDLLLLDIQMPVMGGEEAVRMLRAAGYAGPIVAVTANVMADDVARYRAAGFDDCLAKPLDRLAFRRVLQRYLPARASSAPEAPSFNLDGLIAQFTAELPERLAVLGGHTEAGDWTALKAEAHKLKGSAGALGWPEIGEIAAEIERMVMKEPEDASRRQRIEAAISRARGILSRRAS